MFGIGSQELLIIFLIAFFIFGAKRLPDLGKSLGQSIRGFKNALDGRSDPDKAEGQGKIEKK